MNMFSGHKRNRNPQAGMTLLETVVVLAIIAAITVVFLSGVVTNSKAAVVADDQETAGSLARMQMEWAQEASYVDNSTSYSSLAIPDISDYDGYTAQIAVQPLTNPDTGIQKITVTVFLDGNRITSLESYKRKVYGE